MEYVEKHLHILYQALNDEFAEMTRKKKGLEDEIDLCSTKLSRAEQLIGGLGGEKARWTDLARELQELLSNIIGEYLHFKKYREKTQSQNRGPSNFSTDSTPP